MKLGPPSTGTVVKVLALCVLGGFLLYNFQSMTLLDRWADPALPRPLPLPPAPEQKISSGGKLPNTTVTFLMPVVTTTDLAKQLVHLFSLCHYPFDEVVLVYDTSGHAMSDDELRELERLQRGGLVTRFIVTNYNQDHVRSLYRPLFRKGYASDNAQLQTKAPGDRGYLSYIEMFETCRTDYCVHFDADMVGWSARGFSWVKECIDTLRRYNSEEKDKAGVFCSLPFNPPSVGLARPPAANNARPAIVADDNFSSRVNVIDRRLYSGKLRPFEYNFEQWEVSVQRSAQHNKGMRLRLQEGAWSIHATYVKMGPGPERDNMRRCVEMGIWLKGQDKSYDHDIVPGDWPFCPGPEECPS